MRSRRVALTLAAAFIGLTATARGRASTASTMCARRRSAPPSRGRARRSSRSTTAAWSSPPRKSDRARAAPGGLHAALQRPRERLPGRRRGVPQLHGDDQRGDGGHGRQPGDRQPLQPRHLLRGPGAVGGQDLRQRRRPTRPSPRSCSPAASTRASTSRSRCACTCSTSSRRSTAPTRRSRTSSTRARSTSSSTSTRTAPSTTSPPAPTARGARTASPTGRARSAPTSTATGAGSGAAAAARAGRSRSETYRGASAVLRARDAAGARLRQLARGRRRAADQGAHRLPHLLRARPLALRLHDRQHRAGPDRDRPGGALAARPQHGGDQRLHARAGVATSTSPTARSTTGRGASTRSPATRSRCTRGRRTRASIRPAR